MKFISFLKPAIGIFALTFAFIGSSIAQSPNTASLVVTVFDQNDAVIPGAKISLSNHATGATREGTSGNEGTAIFPALPITGDYQINVVAEGFGRNGRGSIVLRAGETASLKVTLFAVGSDEYNVTVVGTAEGVRTDPIIGRSIESKQIDETPILGRKFSSVPLLNSAFRQAKGTGDLFVNQTYVVTGVGGRRQTTTLLDGASDDEGWGRQTAIATVPIGSVQEVNVLTNAFSAEFGWTAGPALNIVTKSGTNQVHGEALYMFRPGSWQAKSFSTKNFCPESVPTCVVPSTLTSISPIDVPDELNQYSGSIGGPMVKDKTFYFATIDHTRQNRTTSLSSTLPALVGLTDSELDVIGHYRQTLFDGRLDHRFSSSQSLMWRFNLDRFFDDNPQDAVSGNVAPSAARRYSRAGWTTQVNYTAVITPNLLNEARFAYLNGDPVTRWEAANLSTVYTRGGNAPFTIGQSRLSDLWGRQSQFSDTLSWTVRGHYLRFGGSVIRHTSGGTGNEPGQAVLGTFTFPSSGPTASLPLSQLLITDVQNYSQPINFGIDSYKLSQWLLSGFVQDDWKVRRDLTLNLGLRYDRQTLTQADTNFAPRIGFGWNPGGDAKTAIRGGYAMYYMQIRSNAVAAYLVNGLDGLASYTATPGQPGFPTCLTCVPVNIDPSSLTIPPRDIVIRAGQRAFYEDQFAQFGLDFDLLPNYPDKLVNPRSQVVTIGGEREIVNGLFAGADYVHQHLSGIDRTVDLNAPSAFDRTAPGQCRVVGCNNTANVNAANATRPIVPVNNGVRQVNVLMNLGIADYDGLQTQVRYQGASRMTFSVSYTLSKAPNTTEPDGNGINPSQSIITRLSENERGPSVLDQRHRAVIMFSYRLPWGFTAGTLSQFASGRPFNATTGVDNNGDGANNDRPVIDGAVVSKSAFRGPGTQDVSIFVENKIRLTEQLHLLLRLEGFNIFNHANMLGRGQMMYGDTGTPSSTFGQFVSSGTASVAVPAFANIDPPRAFQLQARFQF